jgi:cell division protein FtsB
VKNALTLIPSTGLPPARARLVNLTRRISDAETQLDRLVQGRDQLRAELSRADTARNELDSLIVHDAGSLVGKLRSGASWALSHFGSARAMNLVAVLAESGLQHQVGARALTEIEAEIAVFEREVADLKSGKDDLVRSVLIESAGGLRYDLMTALDHVREAMAALVALDRLTARNDGSYSPNGRIVVEIAACGGLPAQAVVVPEASIVAARNVWEKFSQTVVANPLASADEMKFPPVDPHADEGKILYDRLSTTERKAFDQSRSSGVN